MVEIEVWTPNAFVMVNYRAVTNIYSHVACAPSSTAQHLISHNNWELSKTKFVRKTLKLCGFPVIMHYARKLSLEGSQLKDVLDGENGENMSLPL